LDKRVRELWALKRKEYKREIVHSTTRMKVPFLELHEFREVVSALGFSTVKDMDSEQIVLAWWKIPLSEKMKQHG